MPAIGGFLGWNDPPPAAITIALQRRLLPKLVRTAKSGASALPSVLDRLDHFAEVEHRLERLTLREKLVDDLLAGDARVAGNVVDRLLRIEFGALAARLRQDIDEVASDVEKAEFEDGEEPDRSGADDHDVGLDVRVPDLVGHVMRP